MCPKPNTSTLLSRKSHVEDFGDNAVPALFSVLTEKADPLERWDVKVFPVDIEYNQYGPKKEFKVKMRKSKKFFFLHT